LFAAASTEGRALKASAHAKAWSPENYQSTSSTFPSTMNVPATTSTGSLTQPTLKGYLSKWTNMARGYSTRWIVLEKGTYIPTKNLVVMFDLDLI
jgi:hypothetical protein